MFYSDPDISRTKQTSSYSPEVPENGTGNRRISGGAAARANKLKQKKKSRAPEPPPALADSYHGHFQRRAQSSSDLTVNKQPGGQDCKCVIPEWKPKNRAPPPPPAPPEPPPMPTFAAQNRLYNKETASFERSWNSGKTLPGDRNRSSANSVTPHRKEPIRSDQREKPFSENRTTVFNSKADLSMNHSKKPALLQQRPDPFQKEIEEVTKKIAQNKSMNVEGNSGDHQKDVRKTNAPPKQYYFSDKDLCKADKKPPKPREEQQPPPHQDITRMSESHTPNGFKSEDESVQRKQQQQSDAIVKPKEKDLPSRGNFHLQRFPPIRRQFKDSGNASLDEEEDRRILMNGDSREDLLQNEEKSDIDLRLRPVLPRKTPQLPKFSPIEAWQALGSDGRGSSNQSTSDESIQRYLLQANRVYSKKESRRFYDYKDSRSSYNCTPSDSQWTPRQDLNDSDSSSLASEEVVVPKNRMSEFPTRFSLPTIMFSNVRPIGTEMTSGKRNSLGAVTSYYDRDDDTHANHRKKPGKFDSSQRFKRLLGIRNKYLSEEDISFSDSNWTFGGHGLQHHKRGKQYSSELMLSDKRKYEIMARNNYGGFVEDMMVVPKKSPIKDSFILEDSGNPNFSFYSTDGHVMYLPTNETDSKLYPSVKTGRNGNRRKVNKIDQNDHMPKSMKKSSAGYEVELERAKRSSLDVARMLEDEVRRKRNKEKIAIRQQLRMIKQMDSDNDDDDSDEEVDEAYFTEPKSLEGSSPLHLPSLELPYHLEEMPPRYDRKRRDEGPSRGGGDYTKPLMHWKSSPALLDDQSSKPFSGQNGFNSCSSVTSSPDPVLWQQQQQPGQADKRAQRKQQSHVRRIIGKHR